MIFSGFTKQFVVILDAEDRFEFILGYEVASVACADVPSRSD